MADKKKIFREKSMEMISSPDELNEYIKTSNSGVYLVLVAITVFIVGALIWAIFGRIDSVCDAWVEVNNHKATIIMYYPDSSFPEERVYVKTKGVVLEVMGDEYNDSPIEVTEKVLNELNPSIVHKSGIMEGDWIIILKCDTELENGVYDADVVMESYAPISFIVN